MDIQKKWLNSDFPLFWTSFVLVFFTSSCRNYPGDFFALKRRFAIHSPSLTWNVKICGFQKESLIPECHFQVFHVKSWEGNLLKAQAVCWVGAGRLPTRFLESLRSTGTAGWWRGKDGAWVGVKEGEGGGR